VFVAFASSFDGYHDWTSMPAIAPPNAPMGLHTTGPMTVYINRVPPPSSTQFPLGTIIVKETQEADPAQRTVFAMVKRGGGYDAMGAVGWEWFELANEESDARIVWRGVGPPAGEKYGGDPNGCNGCHGGARPNDFVWTSGLSLSSF
jgi:hypothetical protein